jgi:hypothetical protein
VIVLIKLGFILIMLIKSIQLKKLKFLFIGLLFFTHFFGILEKQDLTIFGLNLISYISIFFFLLELFRNRIYLITISPNDPSVKAIKLFIGLFFIIQSISFILTLLNGFSLTQSLMPFLDFIGFIFLIPFYKLFKITGESEKKTFINLIYHFTILNLLFFILSSTGLLELYPNSVSMNLENNLKRTLEGFPILFIVIFPLIYLKFKKSNNWKTILTLLVAIVALLFTYTRSLILGVMIIVFLTELFISKSISLKKRIRDLSLLFASFIFLSTFFSKSLEAISNRFTEGSSINQIENLNSRFLVAQDRINLTLQTSPIIGLGFISQNESNKVNLLVDKDRLIHPDIFWPNLIVTVGIIGSIIFLIFMVKTVLYFYSNRYYKYGITTLMYLLFGLILTFSSGGVFFKGSIIFAIFCGFAIERIEEEKKMLT